MNNLMKCGLLLLAILSFSGVILAATLSDPRYSAPGNDSDGDGLPDNWEQYQTGIAGGAGLVDMNATSDTDGDGYSDLVEFERDTDPLVAQSTRLEAQNRIAPMIETLNIPEVMKAGQSYQLDWSLVGYEGGYATHIAMFDCTNAVFPTCGEFYISPLYGKSVTSTQTSTAPWTYGAEVASYFNFTDFFTVPATRADGSPWPSAGTAIAIRFYQKSTSTRDAGKPGISLLIPGGLSNVYYSTTGRRVQKKICPSGGCTP